MDSRIHGIRVSLKVEEKWINLTFLVCQVSGAESERICCCSNQRAVYLQVGRKVYPLITHLPEFLWLEVIYNYVFWVFWNQTGGGLQIVVRDGNVWSIVISATLHPLNAALCLAFIHFYNIVKKIVDNSYAGLCLLHSIFLLWNILFPVPIMLLRICLYQDIKNCSSSVWDGLVLYWDLCSCKQ